MGKKYTTETFIERAKVIHGDRYNYDKSQYNGIDTLTVIQCKVHGEFLQTPYRHLIGRNCLQCNDDSKKLTTTTFIERAKSIHGDTYDYTLTVCDGYLVPIIIGCPIHGNYTSMIGSHLSGSGCIQCAIKQHTKTTELFIQRAELTHGKLYDYSKSIYVRLDVNLIIICKTHGEFLQRPDNHITGTGCILCANLRFSKICIEWLESIIQEQDIFIQHANNIGEYVIPGTKYRADGYCSTTNTIYEFYGDYYHGNPKIYEASADCNHYSNLNAGELFQKTIDREDKLRCLGYNLVTIWETDYRKSIKGLE